MSRIDEIFGQLRAEGRKALMPFVTAGYPSIEHTAAILPALERGGASICELGMPFSDPIADGPVIQASMTEALSGGFKPRQALDMVAAQRATCGLGVVAMVSYSIVYRIGAARFVEDSAKAGVDGFIFPDLPLEEASEMAAISRGAGLSCSLLIAPTTPADRAAKIAEAATGFVYVVARTGITGETEAAPERLGERVGRLREATDLPIAVGFGISRPEHVAAVLEEADAAIVGSAIVRRIGEHADEPPEQLAGHIERFIAELARGLPQRT